MLLRAIRSARPRARNLWIISAFIIGTSLCCSCASLEAAAAGSSRMSREAVALLGDAARLRFPDAVPVLFQLADDARRANEFAKADAAIARLRSFPLVPADRYRAELLAASLKLDQALPADALALLDALPLAPDTAAHGQAGLLRATTLEALHRTDAAARERALVHAELPASARAENARRLLDDLGNLEPGALAALRTDERAFMPWLELAQLLYGGDALDAQVERYRAWESRWSSMVSPADLPDAMRDMPKLVATRPAKIALLLPAGGALAPAARAVRDGFMAALLAASGPHPEVVGIDANAGGAVAAYERAVAAGAQFVVGPLDKADVQKLNARGSLPVPVLALNFLPTNERAVAGLYQFGLAPEDEGRAVAEQAFRDGRASVLLIASKADWANRAAASFKARWRELGGQLAQAAMMGDPQGVERDVRAALLVPEAEARHAGVSAALGFTPEFDRRYRNDIDAIVMLARPNEAAAIGPALKAYFANELPMYATSHVNGSAATASADLAGLTFCDSPWRIYNDPLRARVARAWPAVNGETGNLYALGVDAYLLQERVQLLSRRGAKLDGATGELELLPDRRIVREPAWARLNGRAATPIGPTPQ